VAVFRRRDPASGTVLYEAGVPATSELTEFSVVVDSLGVTDTGLALVYLPADSEAPDANLALGLYDAQFTLIGERTLDPLPAGSQPSSRPVRRRTVRGGRGAGAGSGDAGDAGGA
jgi:hypothetical protein